MTSTSPLKLRRIMRGITQIALAKSTGISQQLLSKLESGDRTLSPKRAQELALVLGCRATELLPELALNQQPEAETIVEIELLQIFRALPEADKDTIYSMAQVLADKPKLPHATAN
jgi:transcriptional regulator with XRE-family HTH domain